MRKFYAFLLSICFATVAQAQVNHLVISQVYTGGGNAGATYNADFVELFNPTGSPINLSGFSIQYSRVSTPFWTSRNLSGTIGAGKYFLIRMSNEDTEGASLPAPDFIATPQIDLAVTGGEVALVQSTTELPDGCPMQSSVTDLVGYGNAVCTETAAAAAGSSTRAMYRINNGCTDANNNATDFTTATPAPKNTSAQGAVCGAPVATAATAVTTNSFVANWQAFEGATSYRLDVLRDGASPDPAVSVVAGWTFPDNGTIVTSDTANNNNQSQTITTNVGLITDAAGATTRSASTTPWVDGADTKFWQVQVNATGYTNVTLSSQQRSSGTGPKDFKTQYKIGASGSWTDVPNGNVTVTENFANGALLDVPLPAAVNNKPEVFIRWLMTSNVSVDGGVVGASSTSRIDNVYIRGNGTLPVEFVPGYENITVNGTSKQVTGLSQNTKYYYRVRAVIDGSVSANSNTVQVTTASAAPLPVKFINVGAGKHQNGVVIKWTNSTETDVVYYELERSANGTTFNPLKQIAPKSNAGNSVDYLYIDSIAFATNYYRIKAVETGGKHTYSSIVKATKETEAFTFYPNPVKGAELTVRMTDAAAGKYTISIYNNAGQNIYTANCAHAGGAFYKTISLPKNIVGYHVLEINGPVRLQKQILLQ